MFEVGNEHPEVYHLLLYFKKDILNIYILK